MKLSIKFGNKIGAKLLLAVGVVLVMVLGLSYSSLSAIHTLGASLDRAVNSDAKKLRIVGDIHAGFEEMRGNSIRVELSLVNMLVGRLRSQNGKEGEATCSGCHTKDTVVSQKLRFDNSARALRGTIQELKPLVTTVSERTSLAKIDSGVAAWVSLYEQYMRFAWEQKFDDGHEVMLGKIYPLITSLDKAADQIVEEQQELLRSASQEAQQRVSRSRTVALVLLAFCLGAGCFIYVIVRGVTVTLRRFAGEMKEVTHQVMAAACQISSSSQSLAEGASEQAASLQETSASSEEINIMSHKSAEGSQKASEKMQEAAERVNEANRTLQQMMDSMDAITSSGGRISKIIKVIDEIAFQTNILALNAAVEAARAGEAGMGFAVVADEVRNLAQRCTRAAQDTATLIEESIAMSRDGKGKFDQVAQAMGSITEIAAEARLLVDGVCRSSQEQTRGVEQVARAITQVEKVTQSNAASAEENAAAGSELKADSEVLKDIVGRLVEMV